MNTVIYADILVAVNMIMNYFLLRASAAVTGSDCKTFRIFLSAFAGGVFSLIIFIEGIPAVLDGIIRLIFLAVMVMIAFGAGSINVFLKNCASFFISNFVFAGIMFAVCTFVAPGKAMYKNGVVYFDINIVTLTVSSFVCYGILSLLTRLSRKRTPHCSTYNLTVTYNGKTASCKALYDTGNTLRDSFSGRPVIVVSSEFADEITSPQAEISSQKSFRMIPYSTIGKGGVLPAFLSDKITLESPSQTVSAEKIYIAVTEKKLFSDSFGALIGTPVFEAADNETVTVRSG